MPIATHQAVLEKTGFGVVVIVLFLLSRVAALLLGFALIDLLFGALFIVAYVKTRE